MQSNSIQTAPVPTLSLSVSTALNSRLTALHCNSSQTSRTLMEFQNPGHMPDSPYSMSYFLILMECQNPGLMPDSPYPMLILAFMECQNPGRMPDSPYSMFTQSQSSSILRLPLRQYVEQRTDITHIPVSFTFIGTYVAPQCLPSSPISFFLVVSQNSQFNSNHKSQVPNSLSLFSTLNQVPTQN